MALTVENKASRLFKALMGVAETRLARDFFEEPIRTAASVLPSQVWKYGDRIPDGTEETGGEATIAAIRELAHGAEWTYRFDESTVRPIVKRWKNLDLTMIDGGTNNSFQALEGAGKPIRNIIPFNFGDGISYNYSLSKKNGDPIAFGVGEWVFDAASGVLTFYGEVPAGVDAQNPPRISFFQYVGGLGIPETVTGFEGVIVPITDVEGTANVAAWNSVANPDFYARLNTALDKVWPEFTPTFDWDGNDDNEGVAVIFEKMIPLRYSHSLNPVKSGVGTSADSEVVSLISRRHVTTNVAGSNGFTVDFVSQKVPVQAGLVELRYNNGALSLSLDGGTTFGPATTGFNTLSQHGVVKVANGDAFVIVRRTTGNLPEIATNSPLGITNTAATVGFFYWDTESKSYLPWVNKDGSAKFDFGVPIVMKLGKIPASIKISQMGSGGFADSITPEYYGVRAETVVVAVKSDVTTDNTILPEGADYLVRNEPGAYLENILDKILADRGAGFGGKILLRAGRYKTNQDIVLSNRVAGWKIEGESRDSTIIHTSTMRDITVHADSSASNVYLENLRFSGSFRINVSQAGDGIGYVSLNNIFGLDTDVVVADKCNVTVINCPSLHNLSIVGNTAALGDRLVVSSVFNAVTHNGQKTIFRNIIAQTFTGVGGGIQSWVDSSYIHNLISFDINNQFSNNTVLSYGEDVPERFRMETGFIEVIDTTDRAGERRWTTFADPIIYDTVQKRFTLLIDDRTLEIKEGKLWVKAAADVILFDPNGVARPYDTYEDGTRGAPVAATNVQQALEDLYATKADLVAGKLPLQQLPDAIAHGGLKFKGMWSFEDSEGAYPTWADARERDVDNVAEWPTPSEIQPGWFFVVKNSNQENFPAALQPAVVQDGEDEPLVFTSGDWVIFNGTRWEKVDNSVADAVFSILPHQPPARAGANWDEASGGPGLLALGNTTLVDSLDLVNEILRKLAPPKPKSLSQMTLIARTNGAYTAIDSAAYQVRTTVYDTPTVRFGTPGNETANSGTVNDLFFDGDAGTLRAFIDNVEVGTRVLTPANDVGTYGSLRITADADPHLNVSGQENFWKGLRALIHPATPLALGEHNYRLQHTTAGTANTTATPDTIFYVDNPTPIATMEIPSFALASLPAPGNHMVSGAPSVTPNAVFELPAFTAKNVVGRFYHATHPVKLQCNVSSALDANLTASTYPSTPIDGEYGDLDLAERSVVMPVTAYTENITFTLTPYNSKGQSGTPLVIPTGRRIDTITDHYPNAIGTKPATRVYSGNATERFPVVGTGGSQCGAAYQSFQSIVSGAYIGELQRIGISNGQYRWPNGDYSSLGGPNYTGAAGTTVAGATGSWRWVTFKIDTVFSNTSAFTLTLVSPTAFVADNNRITEKMMMFIRVVGAKGTGWLNVNAPYPGAGIPFEDNAPAMVSGESTASVKRVTFGAETRTGDLYVRIAIQQGSGISFRGITVGSLA
jgi:hypothetical protein